MQLGGYAVEEKVRRLLSGSRPLKPVPVGRGPLFVQRQLLPTVHCPFVAWSAMQVHIAERHLIPRLLSEHGLRREQLVFPAGKCHGPPAAGCILWVARMWLGLVAPSCVQMTTLLQLLLPTANPAPPGRLPRRCRAQHCRGLHQ